MSKPKSSSKRSGQREIQLKGSKKTFDLFSKRNLRETAKLMIGPGQKALLTNITDPSDRLDQIVQDRIKVYGDVRISHQAIGYAFRAVLQNRWHHIEVPEIPADLTAELLAAFKLVRLARPTFHQDSADDLHNYVRFSEDMRKS